MPAADDLISDFDDFHETQPQPELPETAPVAVPTKKSKKKGKKHAAQARARLDDDEDTPYAKSVTPSPPANHGVKLATSLPYREPEPEPEPERIPEVLPEPKVPSEATWYDDTTAVEEPEPSPPKPPAARSSPAPSPMVRSPRPPAAKLASPPTSPPARPASLYGQYGQHAPFPSSGSHRPRSVYSQPGQQRRESFISQRSPRPQAAILAFADPPPPHMPQAHFFGLPDIGLNLAQKPEQGKAAGSDGYCCRFDTFADAGDGSSAKKARDALLVGSECGLDVYRVLPDKMEVVGRLEGLRGAVVDAKILPHTDVSDPLQALRPLVAVVVHGPIQGEQSRFSSDDDLHAQPNLYQTTVELYSLQSQKQVATLYRSTTVRMEQPVVGHLSLPPKPVGELSLSATGNFIVLTSGKSGEVFVFSGTPPPGEDTPQFRCIAKYWTALQVRSDASRPASSSDGSTADESNRQSRVPLMSLSNRWLAIVPPYTSAGTSIQGSPSALESNPQPFGTSTHVAPPQPAITCEVAGIDAEGTLSWLTRTAAQGLVKASQRGYEMSVQGWKELTHPSPPTAQQSHQRSTSQEANMFPPTNAPADDPRRLAKEPALVSIVDLQKLLSAEEQRAKQAPPPLATLALVEGCNHLSFSPDGLRLLTSNRGGEISTVWDLAHVAHGSTKLGIDPEAELERGPHIKQVHRIARSSPSVITDSVWSRDGDWLAVLTSHGTVHLHEIPLTASSRRRKRRSTATLPTPDKAEATVGVSQEMSPPSNNGFLGGWRSWGQSVSTQVSAVKSQYAIPTTFAGFRETAAAARTAGQRAVARGLSQGYSAARSGASDMWHAEDNKVRLKAFQENRSTGSLRWVQRQSGMVLAVVCGGTVYLHPVQRVMRQKGDAMVSGLKKDKHHKNFPLPRISTSRDGSTAAKSNACTSEGPHGFWMLRQVVSEGGLKPEKRRSGSLVSALANEVETNPPYCPFHADPRVGFFAFDDSGYSSQANLQDHQSEADLYSFKTQGHGYAENEEPWVFGEALPPSTKMNEHTQVEVGTGFNGDDDTDDIAGQVQSRLTLHSTGEGEGQEIRVNSRRSRGVARASIGEEGVFDGLEDDDDSMM